MTEIRRVNPRVCAAVGTQPYRGSVCTLAVTRAAVNIYDPKHPQSRTSTAGHRARVYALNGHCAPRKENLILLTDNKAPTIISPAISTRDVVAVRARSAERETVFRGFPHLSKRCQRIEDDRMKQTADVSSRRFCEFVRHTADNDSINDFICPVFRQAIRE